MFDLQPTHLGLIIGAIGSVMFWWGYFMGRKRERDA